MNTEMHVANLHYSLDIRWDPQDNIFVATVPELPGAAAHGETYEEAVANVQEAIEAWVAGEDPNTLPAPCIYTSPAQ